MSVNRTMTAGDHSYSPYPIGHVTKLKMVLPVGKEKAWSLIATPKGLESWFPSIVQGTMKPGNFLEFAWKNGLVERFRIICLGEKHSSFRLEWRHGAIVRFYLHGKMTTLTLEAEYLDNAIGRASQLDELPQWVFYLANLKSVALGGPDLRHRLKGRSKEEGFIDN